MSSSSVSGSSAGGSVTYDTSYSSYGSGSGDESESYTVTTRDAYGSYSAWSQGGPSDAGQSRSRRRTTSTDGGVWTTTAGSQHSQHSLPPLSTPVVDPASLPKADRVVHLADATANAVRLPPPSSSSTTTNPHSHSLLLPTHSRQSFAATA